MTGGPLSSSPSPDDGVRLSRRERDVAKRFPRPTKLIALIALLSVTLYGTAAAQPPADVYQANPAQQLALQQLDQLIAADQADAAVARVRLRQSQGILIDRP